MRESRSVPTQGLPKNVPDQSQLQQQYQGVMQHFDDIPISKIKTMVGY